MLYSDTDKVHVGEAFRYIIKIPNDKTIYVRLSNRELGAMRAAYVTGPFTLYCDMCPLNYSPHTTPSPHLEPVYENHVKAGSHFEFELKSTKECREFHVTLMSEILFSTKAEINFQLTVSESKDKLGKLDSPITDQSLIEVEKMDTKKLWAPNLKSTEPLHLCVLTHGLVSNVNCDLLYLKEEIDAVAKRTGENLVCVGYPGNVCQTERGVKFLGRNLAFWLLNDILPVYKPQKMSFIAHSLGGLIQTYALGFLYSKKPDLLDEIELKNFVCLASPMLGIANENPGYVQVALDFGVVGKTGRDLGLSWAPNDKPLLEKLPNKTTRQVLQQFTRRTVYANSVNDGIVPLRTASLLYLDYSALAQASEREKSRFWSFCDLFIHRYSAKVVKRAQTLNESGEHKVVESLPQKTTLLESGVTLLNPPHPTTEFLKYPDRRPPVIFHDRVYCEDELPERRFKKRFHLCRCVTEVVENSKPEEKIARQYHHGMPWRKVLVKLEPEAHNNIIVRRKFSNAYGWPVIAHLIKEHFENVSDGSTRPSSINNDRNSTGGNSVTTLTDNNNNNTSESQSDSETEPEWSSDEEPPIYVLDT